MKTIESLDGTIYEIAVEGNEVLLMAADHTLAIKLIGNYDVENIESYIDLNFDRAVRTDHELTLVELIDYFKNNK